MMFNIVFFVVIFSMLIQGTTLRLMAEKQGVQEPLVPVSRPHFKSRSHHRDFVEFFVSKNSPLLGKTILDLDFPMDVLVVLVQRGEEEFIPKGNTRIELFDRLVCLIETDTIPEFEKIVFDHTEPA